ncbi:MAG: sigma-70 family RNA polymerase sigma factor [Polyangiaceae bacterium]
MRCAKCISAGQERWPSIEVCFDAFAAYCERAIKPEWGEGARSHAAELYLCCGCACGNAQAAYAFEREGAAAARSAIARVQRDPDFAHEALQELWEKLLLGPSPKAGEYSGRGPLSAWLKVAAARTALDRLRKQNLTARVNTSLDDAVAGANFGPELRVMQERYGDAFQEAFRGAVAALSVRERNILRSHTVGGCSIDQIGATYGVHRATAARWLERIRSQIYDAVRTQLQLSYTALTETEFRSLARAIGPQLELSLFKTTDA